MKRTYYLYGCPACGEHWWTKNEGVTLSDEERVGHECPEDYPPGGIAGPRFVYDPDEWTPLSVVAA